MDETQDDGLSPELEALLTRFNAKAEAMGWYSEWNCDPHHSHPYAVQCGVQRWCDIGGTGPIPPAEPGTKLDPRPNVIGACVQLANLKE